MCPTTPPSLPLLGPGVDWMAPGLCCISLPLESFLLAVSLCWRLTHTVWHSSWSLPSELQVQSVVRLASVQRDRAVREGHLPPTLLPEDGLCLYFGSECQGFGRCS